MNKLTILLLSVWLLSASNKERVERNIISDTPIPGSEGEMLNQLFPNLLTGDSIYGALYAGAHTNPGTTHTPSYAFGGAVYATASEQIKIDGGTMTVADVTLNATSHPQNGIVYGSPSFYFLATGVTAPTFGSLSGWSLAGHTANGVPAFSDSMRLPIIIRLFSPHNQGSLLSLSQGFTIEWNSDPANTDGVLVLVRYLAIPSNRENPSLPDDDISFQAVVADNGTYIVSPSALSGMPAGGIIDVLIARGNSAIVGSAGRYYNIYGYTFSNGEFDLTN